MLRHGFEWSQGVLGKRIGVKQNTISKWEKGETSPPVDLLLALCQTLDTTPNALTGVDDLKVRGPGSVHTMNREVSK